MEKIINQFRVKNPRENLLISVAILTCLGLLMVYTSSSIPAYQKFGDSLLFFKKQCLVSILGAGLVWFILWLPFRWLQAATLPLLVCSVVLLGAIFIPSLQHKANGAARWIQIYGLTFQPAELAKLALIMFFARNLGRKNFQVHSFWRGIAPNLIVFFIFATLLMLQPDFGSTTVLFALTFTMLFTAGLPTKFIIGAIFLGIAGLSAAIYQAPYRMKRLVTFLDPWAQASEGGFQIIQSYLGFQSGGLLGLGLGESRQKLYFLPEAHTDFILSVIGEELGLIGVLLIVAIFTYITLLGFQITAKQEDSYRKFLGFGLTCLIAMQACLNIGVAMGVLPTKGMPLPFVSSGSSSLIIFLVVTAILAKLGESMTET